MTLTNEVNYYHNELTCPSRILQRAAWKQGVISLTPRAPLRPVYTDNFCRSNSMQLNAIFLAPKLQPAVISLRFYCNLSV